MNAPSAPPTARRWWRPSLQSTYARGIALVFVLIAAYGGMALARRGYLAWAIMLWVACVVAIIAATIVVVRRVPDHL